MLFVPQMHVLCYTVWSLMKSLTEIGLSTGDLDHCMPMLVEIFNEELFGELAEEKEVGAITSKLYEAKSSKSYDSYGIMAKFVSKHSLANLVKPLVQVCIYIYIYIYICIYVFFKVIHQTILKYEIC